MRRGIQMERAMGWGQRNRKGKGLLTMRMLVKTMLETYYVISLIYIYIYFIYYKLHMCVCVYIHSI